MPFDRRSVAGLSVDSCKRLNRKHQALLSTGYAVGSRSNTPH